MQLSENVQKCSTNISWNLARNFSPKKLSAFWSFAVFLLLYIKIGRNVSFLKSFMRFCSLIYCLHIFSINSGQSFAQNSENFNYFLFFAFKYKFLSILFKKFNVLQIMWQFFYSKSFIFSFFLEKTATAF